MIPEVKEKIKLFMNVQDFCSDRRIATDKEWERYFIDNYNDDTLFYFHKEDFISYEVLNDYIIIKDFVCSQGSGLKLLLTVLDIADEKKLPTMAFIHKTNTQVLNIVKKRFNFEVLKELNKQYLLIREPQPWVE